MHTHTHTQVDPLYIFNPNSRLSIENDTRLYFSSKDCEEKQKELNEQGSFTNPPKFPTECFFLTAHCAYVTWTSFNRRHRSAISDIKYFRSAVADLEAAGKPEAVSELLVQ